MRSALDGGLALGEALRAAGGSLGALVVSQTGFPVAAGVRPPGRLAAPGPAQVAAAGPRARGRAREYELLLEMILEGVLLHYGVPAVTARPPVVATDDADLALLLGDQLYALGLGRLAALGDLDAVAELGEVISLIAQAAARGEEELLGAVWAAGSAAIGWGGDRRYQQAKALARAQAPGAAAELRAAAARLSEPPAPR